MKNIVWCQMLFMTRLNTFLLLFLIAPISFLLSCSTDEFECCNGTCINSTLRCDNSFDCADKSDEFCGSNTKVTDDPCIMKATETPSSTTVTTTIPGIRSNSLETKSNVHNMFSSFETSINQESRKTSTTGTVVELSTPNNFSLAIRMSIASIVVSCLLFLWLNAL